MLLRSLLLAIVLTFLTILTVSAKAEKGVECELSVYCQDTAATGRGLLVYRDTTKFVEGIRSTGFIANFSLEATFERIDTGSCTFSVQVVTLGPSAFTNSRRFTSEYKLPARFDRIPGKGNTTFSLVMTPLREIAIDTAGCGYVHYRKDDFLFTPSANVDIYYVPRTHGDYFWNAIKTVMEDRYRTFNRLNHFNLPGKCLLYLCPCPIYSVIWDTRFGTMVDPTRNLALTLVNKTVNSADPFVMIHVAVLRNYGYAPPFLSEGLAGYLSFSTYDMKQLVKNNKTIPLDTLLIGDRYYHSDPRVVDATASSFVKYLIDQYKADKLLGVYHEANDLNLKASIESAYGKPLGALEKEWRNYIDTLTYHTDQFVYWAGQAELMMNYPQMLTYRQEQLRVALSATDSMNAHSELARAYYFVGDYPHAAEQQQRAALLMDSSAQDWMALGSYQLMSGDYDAGYANLSRARTMDTANQLIVFNLALYYSLTGQEKKAVDLISDYVVDGGKNPAIAQSRVLLADLLLRTGNKADLGLARVYLRQAYGMLVPLTSGSMITSYALRWCGVLELGLGDTGSANDYLNMALFLDECPFDEGMDYLWLGKTADVRGERDVAKEYYSKVLAIASSDYHKKEAQQLLDHPFTK